MSETNACRLERTRYGRPKLRCTDDVTRYWIERSYMTAPAGESFEYSSMICRGDSLFHYGSHFELARILRDKRGVTRLILLNGDTWRGSNGFGPATSTRQAQVRGAVARTSWPSLLVPFSALEGAGIDFQTIEPIDVRSDWETVEEHSSRKPPTKDRAWMDDPSGATKTVTRWQYPSYPGTPIQVEVEEPVQVRNPDRTIGFRHGHGWSDGADRDEDGVWHWETTRHWLGDSLFRARTTERRTRKATPAEIEVHEAHLAYEREKHRLEGIESGWWRKSWELDNRIGNRRLNDRYPSYQAKREHADYRTMVRCLFAAEGFRQRAQEAREAVDEHRRTNHVWGNGMLPGNRQAITVTRWATFLSSFDYQERPALYFLCELPRSAKPATVEEAIEALKPPEVVAALARGLAVIRQGDLFAIPTQLTKRQLRRMQGRRDFERGLRVLGTNHAVTEGIVLKGGAVLGRGIMRHEPDGWRPPDHKRVKLGDGKTWHLLVRNTVPRTR